MEQTAMIEQVKAWLGTDDELQARAVLEATEWNLAMCRNMLAESMEVSLSSGRAQSRRHGACPSGACR